MSLDIWVEKDGEEVFNINITHNLAEMASKCGLYEAMWRPYKILGYADEEEDNVQILCKDIVQKLYNGIINLLSKPEFFKKYNPKNGWGSYEFLLKKAIEYYLFCKENEEGIIYVSR